MSIPNQRTAPDRMSDEELVAFVQNYEPVKDVRKPDNHVRECSGKCGRTVALDVALCVRCRNTSRHPAFGR